MEKMVKCHYWKEYQGLNGWTMFCSAGAFSKEFSKDYAEGLFYRGKGYLQKDNGNKCGLQCITGDH